MPNPSLLRSSLRTWSMALCLCTAAGGALAQNSNSVRVTGGVLNLGQTTSGAPAVVGAPFVPDLLNMAPGEVYFGQAEGLSNTLRGTLAQKDDSNSNEPQGRSVADFVKTAQSASLPTGTPILATVSFTLDGSLTAGALDALTGSAGVALAAGQGYSALASAQVRVRVIDLDNPSSTLSNPSLDFRYVTALELYMRSTVQSSPFVHRLESASAFQSGTPWLWANNTDSNVPQATAIFDVQSMLIPVRSFSFQLDTAVGHRLNTRFELVLDTSGTSQGGLVYVASADFGRTFDAELTGPAGLSFGDDLPGVAALPGAPVPEPAAAWLWLLGLGALSRHCRRRA